MSEYTLVMCTVGTIDEAKKICRKIVESRIVACASIIPLVESFFLWDGIVEESAEVKILLKTHKELYPLVERFIKEHHSYQVPEILAIKIEEGNLEYLRWITASIET